LDAAEGLTADAWGIGGLPFIKQVTEFLVLLASVLPALDSDFLRDGCLRIRQVKEHKNCESIVRGMRN
jgi:hypothetical protein